MKKTDLRILLGVYLSGLLVTSITPLSLVLESMSRQFPDASAASIQFVYTLATGAGLIGSLLVGLLSSRFTKKTLLCGCMVVIALGGVLGFLGYGSMALLLAASLILGAAVGGSDPLSTALISEHFEGDQRAKWNGLKSVVVSFGGMGCTFLGGILAAGQWRNIYMLYMSAAIFFLVLVFLLPGGKRGTQTQENSAAGQKGKLLNPMVLRLYLLNFLVSICWVVYNSNISFLLEGNTEQSSLVTMAFMAAMTIAGFFVAPLRKCFGQNAVPATLVLLSASLWLFTQSQGRLVLLFISAAMLGFAFCAYTALSFTALPEYASAGMVTQTITFFSAISTGGSLIHPYLITLPAAWFGSSVMNRFYLCAVLMTAGTIFAFRIMAAAKKQGTQSV